MNGNKHNRFFPSPKKLAIFDVSNTLIDRQRTLEHCFAKTLEEFTARWSSDWPDWNPADVKNRYMTEWRRKRGSLLRTREKFEARTACLAYALKPYPLEVTPSFAHSFFAGLKSHQAREAVAVPDALRVISELSGRYQLAILSNGFRADQSECLEKLGLTAYFPADRIFTPQRTGARKPAAKAFLSVSESLGVPPSGAVMVGDSWRNDIVGATQAGMDAVWILPSADKKISLRKAGIRRIVTVRSLGQLLGFM